MPIFVDLSQVLVSNLFANLGSPWNPTDQYEGTLVSDPSTSELSKKKTTEINEDGIRHMILNSLRSYKVKYQSKYGKLVIAADNKKYWRKEIFQYYKANRKKNRDNSPLDWHLIFESLNKIRDELVEFFPYRVFNIERAEADDVIAVLSKYCQEKSLILSGDRDFIQLHQYPWISQYSPVQKKFLESKDPILALREKIMKGDQGDGIPNFLSDDDCFVKGKRQTPIRKDKLERWVKEPKPENFCDNKMLKGYKRNQELISFEFIPKDIVTAIKEKWDEPFVEYRKKLLNYFVGHKLVNLMDVIGEF